MESTTNWTLYNNNEDAWNSILHDCANAKTNIDLEQFIFTADDFGQRLINICIERAAHGVKVRFLWDSVGSFTFWGSNIVDDLKSKNIELVFWKTLIPEYFKVHDYRSWYFRNHRRTLVIDRKIAYTGSMCIRDSMRNWRDTNVRAEGALTVSMQNAFDRMWARAQKSKPLPARKFSRDGQFMYVTNSPAPGKHHINRHIREALRKAESFVYITTPYFIPSRSILKAIKQAAKKNVDIRIILPERSDHYPTLDLGARSFFETLLEEGVRIFLYSGKIIHSKSIIVDNKWATVGSLNLDNASLLYNYEANIITTNQAFARELSGHFNNDLTQSKEVTLNEWRNRFFIEKIPEILIRLVRKFL